MSATYIRTHLFRHASIQRQVAASLRTLTASGSEFGEDDLYAQWATHLQKAGATEAQAVEQASAVAEVFVRWAASPGKDSQLQDTDSPALGEIDAPVLHPSADAGNYTVPDPSGLQVGMYISSVQRKGQFKRLHRLGDCALKPGRDYASWEVHGFEEPASSSYHGRCKWCFKGVQHGLAPSTTLQSSEASVSSDSEGASSVTEA